MIDEKTLKYIATYFVCFLSGFFVPGIALYVTGSFAVIKLAAVLFMVVSAIIGLFVALSFATLLKTDIYLSTSSFTYGFLGAAFGVLGFATGCLVLLLLGAT